MALPRIELAQLPTPLEPLPRLSEAWGGPTIWVKRDDLTGFGLSGNKVRKLEVHLAVARQADASRVITCGAVQSNHCRATAIAGAREAFATTLLLRSPDGRPPQTLAGNHLIDQLAGADIRYITPAQYADRNRLMAEVAAELGGAWVIPEGGSDALGARAFSEAGRELAEQWDAAHGGPATWWHASSSGGTTAGLALAIEELDSDAEAVACSVGDSVDELQERLNEIWEGAGVAPADERVRLMDQYVGGGYGQTTPAELAVQVEATRLTGLLFDPTYTGKAIFALHQEIAAGRFAPDDHVIFWHTGGGFAGLTHDYSSVL